MTHGSEVHDRGTLTEATRVAREGRGVQLARGAAGGPHGDRRRWMIEVRTWPVHGPGGLSCAAKRVGSGQGAATINERWPDWRWWCREVL